MIGMSVSADLIIFIFKFDGNLLYSYGVFNDYLSTLLVLKYFQQTIRLQIMSVCM